MSDCLQQHHGKAQTSRNPELARVKDLRILDRDNSSHNLTVAHSCGHGTPVGSGPQSTYT